MCNIQGCSLVRIVTWDMPGIVNNMVTCASGVQKDLGVGGYFTCFWEEECSVSSLACLSVVGPYTA